MEKQEKSKYLHHLIKIVNEFDNQKLQKNDKELIQKKGVVYTPRYLADYIVKKVFKHFILEKFKFLKLIDENKPQLNFDPKVLSSNPILKKKILNEIKEVKILDPSCGSGIFLVSAAEYLFQLNKSINPSVPNLLLKKKIVHDNIFGVELDKKSCQISKLRLITWILKENGFNIDLAIYDISLESLDRVEEKLDFKLNILNFDFLLEFAPKQNFDLIIGNPPYIENKKIENNDFKKKLAKNFLSAYKLYDLSILFIEKAMKILNMNGYISFLLTNKLLAADYGFKIRSLMINNSIIKEIINISSLPVFSKSAAYPIILFLKKKNPCMNDLILMTKIDSLHQLKKSLKIKSQKIPLSLIKKLPRYVIPISENYNLIKYLYSNFNMMSETIKDLQIIYRPFGFLKWDDNFKNISEKKHSDKDLILIGTGNVEKYHILFKKRIKIAKKDIKVQYFRYNEDFHKVWQELSKEKLIFREIAKNLTFVYDPGIFTNITGLYFIRIPSFNTDGLFALLTILNSELIDDVFKILFGTLHMSGGYLRFNGSFIKRLPLPEIFPKSLSRLGKILQFLSQLYYDLNSRTLMNSNETDELKLYLSFYIKLSNSLVNLLYLKNENPLQVEILNKLLKSKNSFPDIKYKYNVPRFEIENYKIAQNGELKDNLLKIKQFYEKFNNEKFNLEMLYMSKFKKYN
ncbi:MAG: Eco57I restriction-modification methylase domain-containing protein [Promethearchaeota archaeon]